MHSNQLAHAPLTRSSSTRLVLSSVLVATLATMSVSAPAADAVDRTVRAASSATDRASNAISHMGQTSYTGMADGTQWERTHRASRILGMDVRNRQGDKIGEVKDVVLDKNGTIAYAVVSTGGFLGMGDRLHAVPWNALETPSGKKDYILDMDKQRLKTAPSFDSGHWPNFTDEAWAAENRRYYRTPQ